MNIIRKILKKIKNIKKWKKIVIIVVIIAISLIIYNENSYTCDEGTLINKKCYNCPEGYTLNIENKDCILNEKIDEDLVKTDEEIIQLYKEQCKKYEYDDIFRYAEKYDGEFAKFTGKVIQISDYIDYQIFRVNVTPDEYGYYDDTIYVTYIPMKGATRILEDDIVIIYGILDGLETYTTVLNASITIPKIISNYIEIQNI